MSRRNKLAASRLALLPILAALAGLIAAFQPAASQPAPPFKPVQSVHQMMEGQNKLFKEIKDGILDEAWSDAEKSAWLLAEVANVNQFQNDESQYKQLAGRMSDECVALAKMLRKRDAKSAKDQVGAISKTCSACHDQYKKD